MHNMRKASAVLGGALLVVLAWSFWAKSEQASSKAAMSANDQSNNNYAQEMLKQGREIFRFDTFGDESYWGDTLQLHHAIAGGKLGGIGPGVSPKTALAVGLKVDLDALPAELVDQLKAGRVNLDDAATTLALLKLNSVVGVTVVSTTKESWYPWGFSAHCATPVSTTLSFPVSVTAWMDGLIET